MFKQKNVFYVTHRRQGASNKNQKRKIRKMNETTISNQYTGYHKTIRHKNLFPAVSTVKKHLRAAKASDCKSWTKITQQDGKRTIYLDIVDTGHGECIGYLG